MEQVADDTLVDVLQFLSVHFGVNPVGFARQFPATSCQEALRLHANKDHFFWVKDGHMVLLRQCN